MKCRNFRIVPHHFLNPNNHPLVEESEEENRIKCRKERIKNEETDRDRRGNERKNKMDQNTISDSKDPNLAFLTIALPRNGLKAWA